MIIIYMIYDIGYLDSHMTFTNNLSELLNLPRLFSLLFLSYQLKSSFFHLFHLTHQIDFTFAASVPIQIKNDIYILP